MQAYTSAMHKFGVEAAAPSPPTGRAPPPPPPRGAASCLLPLTWGRGCFLFWGLPGDSRAWVTMSSNRRHGLCEDVSQGDANGFLQRRHRGDLCPGPRPSPVCVPASGVFAGGRRFAPTRTASGCPSGSQAIFVRATAPKLHGRSDAGCCREAPKGPSVSQPAMGRFPLLANARLWPLKSSL